MQPLLRQGISTCWKTDRSAINTIDQAAISVVFSLFCCLVAVLITAPNFSAADASVSDSGDAVVTTAPQAPAQPEEIPILSGNFLTGKLKPGPMRPGLSIPSFPR